MVPVCVFALPVLSLIGDQSEWSLIFVTPN